MTMMGPTVSLQPPRPRRRTFWRFLLMLVIFFAGLTIGVALTVLFALHAVDRILHHPEEAPARITALISHKLDLSPSQTRQTEQIIALHQQKIQEARRSIRPVIEEQIDEVQREVSAILTDDQRQRWYELVQHARDRWLVAPPPATQPVR